MTPRLLPAPLAAYRIGDPDGAFPIFSDGGARLASGRWHEAGAHVIYASEHYATAMLEKLVHFAGRLPRNQHFIAIALPAGLSYEVMSADHLPGWAAEDGTEARAFGRRWHDEGRSALLIVPSVVARMERNIVINTRHADFTRITTGLETPVRWDKRLFG